ncbi:tumor protein p53-inducible protein 11-like [Artemia franciscana]|uniref:Tumor protein p53-inducible protein 11 n=1 Tax=Artemia franciscana TaxID=6661 RepID=A0AA88HJQ1_ARTSF|nr:hypothetical protein QYM36_011273 [Artemia franciscana]KAK2712523.1 hypothetical protein QYM36_011273 [Artemia franciscana]KAK2712524.1 hypothetical protein QYM36_011273 [Artemia franciscana]KAK2712525.1 hypothetical protein QYM36_011273 [Artemia franciscana]
MDNKQSSNQGSTDNTQNEKTQSSRAFSTHKLERKNSTGDLLSRLKSRKMLGVGETENGEIHRSKISQLLGCNEHLYVKFPRGLSIWQWTNILFLSSHGLSLMLAPKFGAAIASLQLSPAPSSDELASHRLHGAALLGFSFLLWRFIETTDKTEARTTTASLGIYHALVLSVTLLSSKDVSFTILGARAIASGISFLYNRLMTHGSGIKRSPSFNNVNASGMPEGSDKKDL